MVCARDASAALEDLAGDERDPAELGEGGSERPAARRCGAGTVYDPDAYDVGRAELAADTEERCRRPRSMSLRDGGSGVRMTLLTSEEAAHRHASPGPVPVRER